MIKNHAEARRVFDELRLSDQYAAAWEIFKKYRDWKDLSYTDCLSFALMEEMGITRAFTFDSDFRAYGFTQLP